MTAEPRKCYWIDPVQDPGEYGYIPSIVTEGESGHSPLTGNGACASPWYWGKTYKKARAFCDQMNANDFGLTPGEAAKIVASSMAASR